MQTKLTFKANFSRPVADVYEHLANPQNFIGLQPLLIEISKVQETQEAGITTIAYETVEEFIFLSFLKYHNHIQVQLRLTEPGHRMQALVASPGAVKLQVEYLFQPTAQGCQLEEIFQIEAPRLWMGFVIQQATQAQTTVLMRLQKRMEVQ